MKNLKKYIIWFVIWVAFLSLWVYAMTPSDIESLHKEKEVSKQERHERREIIEANKKHNEMLEKQNERAREREAEIDRILTWNEGL